MKIYLVRHGMDEDGYRGGWSQRGLIEEGIIQSSKLASHLHEHSETYRIHTILSSDLPRAVETAQIITRRLGIDAVYSEHWREMNNGLLAGMPHHEAEAKFPGVYFNTLNMNTPFPEGESPVHFNQRITNAFDLLCDKLDKRQIEHDVLLVTHGGVINVLYYHLTGQKWSNTCSSYPIDNTSVHIIEKKQEQWKITTENQTLHLCGGII